MPCWLREGLESFDDCLTVATRFGEAGFEWADGYHCGCEVQDCATIRARFDAMRRGGRMRGDAMNCETSIKSAKLGGSSGLLFSSRIVWSKKQNEGCCSQ